MPPDPHDDVRCSHCDLPVPAGLLEDGAAVQFCCAGCRGVYDLLAANGLGRYYELCDDQPLEPVTASDRSYAEFADPGFVARHCRQEPNGLQSCELYLEGVHCAACVWLLEKLPRLQPGVVELRLNMGTALARVVWDPGVVALPAIASTLHGLGYSPHPARGVAARDARVREDRASLVRLAAAGACAGNAMLLAFALYAGMLSGIDPLYEQAFRVFSLGIGLLCLAWPGAVFFRGAWAAIRLRTPHMDIPVALGLLVGGVSGAVNTVTGRGDIYFDSLTVLVFLLLVGRHIQRRQQRVADDAVDLLFSLTPTVARRVDADGVVREVPAASLRVDDVVLLRDGDLAPADGAVVDGRSRLDESVLTGESRPVSVGPGDAICAGTQNLGAPLQVRVTAAGEETRVAKLLALVAECSRRRAPIVQTADRLAGWFAGGVVLLAGLTLALWWGHGPATATNHTVALLIVACPCALGLATPLALSVALGRAARRQILVKGADTLERLARPGLILLDKTGTLTRGRMSLAAWTGDAAVQPLVVALERAASHPIARAITAAWEDAGQAVIDAAPLPGGGLSGTVDGRRLQVGSPAAIATLGIALPAPLAAAVADATAAARTPVVVAVDGVAVGVAAIGDVLRPDARETLDTLRQRGWQVGILSGDHADVVTRVASELAIPPELTWGGCTPETKLAVVQAAGSRGPVVMVGDGVNDAAALAAATVGIAVHGGAEASLAAADVYLSRDGLAPIVDLLATAKRAMRTIHRNLAVSLAYNLIAVVLAMTGVLSPLLAAIIMPLSSLTVLTLSLAGDRAATREATPPARPAADLRGAVCP